VDPILASRSGLAKLGYLASIHSETADGSVKQC